MINGNNSYGIIYIREDYETISNQIFDTISKKTVNNVHYNFNIMVSGNPGIGKSYFYLFMIFKFLSANGLLCGKTLVINSDNNFFKYSNTDCVFEDVNPFDVKFDKTVLRLIDGRTSDSELTSWSGSNILFASPSDDVNNKPSTFMTNQGQNYYYMTVWSENELLIANSLLPDNLRQEEDAILNKIAIAGPIPRSVLMIEKTLENLKATINGAVSSIHNPIEIVDYVRERKSIKESNYSHTLLKMTPTSCGGGYYDFTVSFLSAHIAGLVIDACMSESLLKLKTFACQHGDAESAKFRGNIYEHFIHSLIVTQFCLREVRALSDRYNSFTLPALPPNLEVIRFRRLIDIIIKNGDRSARYFVPVIPNLGAYDGILWDGESTCYLIQITIAKEHHIKNEPVRLFLAWSAGRNLTIKFVFIVPENVYEFWTVCQKLVGVNNKTLTDSRQVHGLEQYVMQMNIVEQV